jgi:hypothetical protein
MFPLSEPPRFKNLGQEILLWSIIPVVFYSVAWNLDVPFENVSRDAADLYNFHPLIGVLSNIGLLLWTASAAILFFSAHLIKDVPEAREERATLKRFGVLSSILLVDDLFLIHEQVAPRNLKISEKLTYMIYGAAFLGFLWRSRAVLLRSHIEVLVAALASFALSVGLDVLPNWLPQYHYALEDSPKFVGIGLWTAFFVRLSRQSIANALGRSLDTS